MSKVKNQEIIKKVAFAGIFLIMIIGLTYAWLTLSLNGTKDNVLRAGRLSLILDDTMGDGINIVNTSPITDEEGYTLVPYTFTLENNGDIVSDYTIYLDDIDLESGETRMKDSVIKYNLTRDIGDIDTTKFLSTTGVNPNRIMDQGTIDQQEIYTYTLRLWIDSSATSEVMGTTARLRLRVEASQQEEIYGSIVLINMKKEEQPNPTTFNMFQYTSEGCTEDPTSGNTVCDNSKATNGVYSYTDDEGPTYYFRGDVNNNWVRFGKWQTDRYTYINITGAQETRSISKIENYNSLSECQAENPSCSDANKIASAGDPMYWRIIRVNGSGTVRMIYAGTTTDSDGVAAGIGQGMFNTIITEPKYSGYTYDNGTASTIKTSIDSWYNAQLLNTKYDQYIANETFISDTSGYQEFTDNTDYTAYSWNSLFRLDDSYAYNGNPIASTTPNLTYIPTTENYGGKYKLKVGLINIDEVVLAGGKLYYGNNSTYYLYNSLNWWTISPAAFFESEGMNSMLWTVSSVGFLHAYNADYIQGVIRPVINLTIESLDKTTGNGTANSPYVLTGEEGGGVVD